MRRPIQRQLLVPVLWLVISSIALSSGLTAFLAVRAAREQQSARLTEVVRALTDARFPLTDSVVEQMRGLTGAEFVVLDPSGKPLARTVPVDNALRQRFEQLPLSENLAALSAANRINLAGESYLTTRVSVKAPHEPEDHVTLVILYPEKRWQGIWRQAVLPPLLTGAAAVLFVALVISAIARRLVRPIEALRQQAERIASGDFEPSPVPPRHDEIQDLTQSLNTMAERLAESQRQIQARERMRTLGQLEAGLAHQLRNAATGGGMALDLHEQECPRGSHNESLDVARRQLKLIETHLQQFLTLGRPWNVECRPLNIAAVVDDALELMNPLLTHTQVRVTWDGVKESATVVADAAGLRQVVVNLLDNAVAAVAVLPATNRAIDLELERTKPDNWELTIRDCGAGPDPLLADAIFDPFVTGRAEGTGLGLAVARQIVEQHQGTLTWRRRQDRTEFVMSIPADATVGVTSASGGNQSRIDTTSTAMR